MKEFNSYKSVKASGCGCVVAIGNFDGIHKGHQSLIQCAMDHAEQQKTTSGVLTFHPHPRRFFDSKSDPFLIASERQKKRRLEKLGIDCLFDFPFDHDFASLSAEDFITNVLAGGMGVKEVIVGSDFRYGAHRKGDVELLKQKGAELGFIVTIFDPVLSGENYVISSTAIRERIRNAEFEEASELLGWIWEMDGEVVHGDKRGRELGYPTANVYLGEYIRPRYGIYAVRVLIEGENKWRNGVASIGIRPMFEVKTPLCEAYIFGFDKEIYGKNMRIQPIQFLRPEKRFDDLDVLVAQMKQDEQQARDILENE